MPKVGEEEAVIREAIARADLPDFVEEVRLLFDLNSIGAEAVWLYVILSDKAANSRKFHDYTRTIHEKLGAALDEAGLEWFYIRFRSFSEQQEIDTMEDED